MFSHEELLSQFLCNLIPMNKISSDLAVLWFLLKVDGKFQGEPDLMPVAFIHSTEKGISRWREIAIWFSVLHWNGSGNLRLFIQCWSCLSSPHLFFWRMKCMKIEICLGACYFTFFCFIIFFNGSFFFFLDVLVGLSWAAIHLWV